MSNILIGLSGYAGSGKDAVADILCEEFGFVKYAFADPMREMARQINPIVGFSNDTGPLHYVDVVDALGYRRAKDEFPEVRRFLQKLGTEGGRKVLGEDIWVLAALKKIDGNPLVVFPDVRFINEAMAIIQRYGTIIRVDRPGVLPLNDHPSERELDNFSFGMRVNNDGSLQDLKTKIVELVVSRFPTLV